MNSHILFEMDCKDIKRSDPYNPKDLVNEFLLLFEYLIEKKRSLPSHLQKVSDSISKIMFVVSAVSAFSKRTFAFIGNKVELGIPKNEKISLNEALSRRIELNRRAGKDNSKFNELNKSAQLLKPLLEDGRETLVNALGLIDDFYKMPERVKRKVKSIKIKKIYIFSIYYMASLAIALTLAYLVKLFLGDLAFYITATIVFLINSFFINVRRQKWERGKYWDLFEVTCDEFTTFKNEIEDIISKLEGFLQDKNINNFLKIVMDEKDPTIWSDPNIIEHI